MKKKAESAKLKIIGEQTFELFGKDGKIKQLWNENFLGKFIREFFGRELRIFLLTGFYGDKMVHCNLVTNAGFAGIASRINGADSEAAFTYLGTGTGTTAANAADTALETPITDSGLERASATCSRVQTTVANDTAQLLKAFSVTGTKAVTECGAFNASTNGVLLGHQVFAAINVVSGDTLQITYKFKAA